MQQNTGGVKAINWVAGILSRNRQMPGAKRQNDTTEYAGRLTWAGKPLVMFTGANRDSGSRESEGPDPPENGVKVIPEVRPPQIPRIEPKYGNNKPESVRLLLSGANNEMNPDVAVQTSPPASGEKVVQKTAADDEPDGQPPVNIEEMADMVYRLMQRDLILERERSTRIGG